MAPPALQRTVLITGCSKGGIGDALAQAFYNRGFKVFATARDVSKVVHLQEIGMSTLELDIVSIDSIKNAVKAVSTSTGGTLDFLINNAGAGYSSPLVDANIEAAKRMFEVNVFGRARVTQEFVPLLLKSRGTIVNIGSIAAYYPSAWQGMYAASCAAQHQWSDVLRIEMDPFDVKVILVVTGAISTHFIDNLPTTQLQKDSIYAPGKDAIEAVMNATAVKKNFVSPQGYAEKVVSNAVKSWPTRRLWTGGVSTSIWLVSTFLPATAWDFILSKPFGIAELKRKLQQALV